MSMDSILDLKPEILWQRFYEISQVPRPSKKEEKILNYLRNFFNSNSINFKEDDVHNLCVEVKATPGYENSPKIILQAHVDMVCEKNKGTIHDFENDPIKLVRSNGWIKADGTTLGADNGIGVAAALAIITDKDAVHGPIEILLTVDEETGLTGATNLNPNLISANTLINLDSEEDGAFYVGCSGGVDTIGIFELEFEPIQNLKSFEILVSGLKGGHSGLEIHKGRANAIKLLARILKELFPLDARISEINGGSKRNAIPREAEAVVSFSADKISQFEYIIKQYEKYFQNEFCSSDSDIKVSIKPLTSANKAISDLQAEAIVNTLLAVQNGVIEMNHEIEGLVETSTNLATVITKDERVTIGTSQRSSIQSAIDAAALSISSLFELAGAEVKSSDGYPGWQPDMNSKILNLSKKVFKEIFYKEPEIKAIHAGLECGILGAKKPGMEMISFGPTITGAHSPDEKIEIETVNRFYSLLKGILKAYAEMK